MKKSPKRDTEVPPPICPRCGGSGVVPVIPHGPYVEDGDVREEYPLKMCEDCLGTSSPIPREGEPAEE